MAKLGWYPQAFNHLTANQMGVDDFINVAVVHVGVPNTVWLHHGYRAGSAPVQASRFVNPDLACTGQAGLAYALLAAVKSRLGAMLGTAVFTTFSLVQTKKYMPCKVGLFGIGGGYYIAHARILVVWTTPGRVHQRDAHRSVRPDPTQPLGKAVKANKATLLPSLQGLCEVGAIRRLVE